MTRTPVRQLLRHSSPRCSQPAASSPSPRPPLPHWSRRAASCVGSERSVIRHRSERDTHHDLGWLDPETPTGTVDFLDSRHDDLFGLAARPGRRDSGIRVVHGIEPLCRRSQHHGYVQRQPRSRPRSFNDVPAGVHAERLEGFDDDGDHVRSWLHLPGETVTFSATGGARPHRARACPSGTVVFQGRQRRPSPAARRAPSSPASRPAPRACLAVGNPAIDATLQRSTQASSAPMPRRSCTASTQPKRRQPCHRGDPDPNRVRSSRSTSTRR